jgi:lysophospholipase L1-like esterase
LLTFFNKEVYTLNAGMKRILAVLSVISCSAAAILSPAEHVLAQDYTAGTSPADADISGQQPYTPVPENPAWQLPVNEAISGGQESADGSYPGQALDSSQPEAEPDESTDVPDEETITLTVTASLAKDGTSAKISWKKTGTGEVSSYLVQRSTSRDGKYKTIARLASGKSYTDQTVTGAKHFYYRIAAKAESGKLYYSRSYPFQCPLEPLPGVKLVRYSTDSVKVMWDKSKNKKAVWYKVYYAKSKSGRYRLAGVTQNNWYRVKKLKNGQNYYFGVKACTAKNASGYDSQLSKPAKMKARPYERMTIFAGDSITAGLTAYGVLDEIAIGRKKSVVAAIGLNTITFRTRKAFHGKSATESIVASRPYRVYIMLGDNDIHFRNKNDLIDGYREIVRAIQAGTPDTDIVILAASPVTAAEVSRRRGFAQIPAYNQALSALAAEMGVKYYDCTGFLKDSTGWLKSAYNAGDGVHWKAAAYHEYAKRLTVYDKSLD